MVMSCELSINIIFKRPLRIQPGAAFVLAFQPPHRGMCQETVKKLDFLVIRQVFIQLIISFT